MMKNCLCKRSRFLSLVVLLVAIAPGLAGGHDVAQEMADAATVFMKSLDDAQAAQIAFDFEDPKRKDWHFIPKDRAGLSFGEMRQNQRHLAMSVLHAPLSHRGFKTTLEIMALEQVLFEMEKQNPRRDAAKYHLFLFGKPSTEATWGWRIEGHHLSISFTIVDGKKVVTTPAFFGANPGEVRQGKLAGLRVLAAEEDLARALVKQLSVEQKSVAIIPGKAPRDVVSGPGREAKALSPAGISARDLTEPQQKLLRQLVDCYLNKFRSELASEDWRKIEASGFDKLQFAWMGEIAAGKPHYYRIQGPTFIMEYDNTQNGANHVHTVWRDFQNDFGEDMLRKHYQEVPHESSVNQ